VGLPIHGFYDMKDCFSGIEREAHVTIDSWSAESNPDAAFFEHAAKGGIADVRSGQMPKTRATIRASKIIVA
jgi:hypothetical protein